MSNTYQINKKVRDAFILNLRRIFTGDPQYPYVETMNGELDFFNTKIAINDVIAADHAFYPAVVVEAVAGNEIRFLGPDDYLETKDNNNVVQTDQLISSLVLTVNVLVFTIDDTIARDEIVDRIYDHLKLITDDLASSGIEVIRQNFLPDQRVFQGDRWYIRAGMSFEIYTEWTDDGGVANTVQKIPIDVEINP